MFHFQPWKNKQKINKTKLNQSSSSVENPHTHFCKICFKRISGKLTIKQVWLVSPSLSQWLSSLQLWVFALLFNFILLVRFLSYHTCCHPSNFSVETKMWSHKCCFMRMWTGTVHPVDFTMLFLMLFLSSTGVKNSFNKVVSSKLRLNTSWLCNIFQFQLPKAL